MALIILFVVVRGKLNPESQLFRTLLWMESRLTQFRAMELLWMALISAGFIVVTNLVYRGGRTGHGDYTLPVESPFQKAAVAYVTLCTSVTEELIFRGVVLGLMSILLSPFWGVLISASLFGLAHVEKRPMGMLLVLFLGLTLGAAVSLGLSLWTAVGVHFINNSASLVLLFRKMRIF